MKKILFVLFIGMLICGLSRPVLAGGFFGPDPDEAPSVFSYAYRGFGIGALLGMSAGYLALRDFEDREEEWKDFGQSLGVGALTGTVGGLAIGLYDLNLEKPGLGGIVLRDTLYGTVLGGLVGAVAGGLAVISSSNGEDIVFGASIGSLCGAVLGVAMGFIEGPRIVDGYYSSNSESEQKEVLSTFAWDMGITTVKDKNNRLAYIPVVNINF